jgi:hypothetical protein
LVNKWDCKQQLLLRIILKKMKHAKNLIKWHWLNYELKLTKICAVENETLRVHVRKHTHTHIHTYTYTHTQTHTNTQTPSHSEVITTVDSCSSPLSHSRSVVLQYLTTSKQTTTIYFTNQPITEAQTVCNVEDECIPSWSCLKQLK